MSKYPKCPYCGESLYDGHGLPDFNLAEAGTGNNTISLWMLWCRHCGKLLSAFPSK